MTEIRAELIPFPRNPGLKLGRLILDRPKALNALSLGMLETLHIILKDWAADASIAMVWLEGSGERAFCAGGDVASIYRSIQSHRASPADILKNCQHYFVTEYRTDYSIHRYPKPVVVWGDGVVMGGGIGLMVGASHRIVTEKSLLAMPEVAIGLYPDVGASRFLTEMPGKLGLFVGLTGYRMNAGDALSFGLADHFVERDKKGALWDKILALDVADSPDLRQRIDESLRQFQSAAPPSPVKGRQKEVEDWMKGDDLKSLLSRFLHLGSSSEDAMLKAAQDSVRRGSPTSLGITFEQWRRSRGISLEDAFRQELILSVQCCLQTDFSEGVRALLIDKDNSPQWRPRNWEDLSPEEIESYFRSPWPENPLRDLGAGKGNPA